MSSIRLLLLLGLAVPAFTAPAYADPVFSTPDIVLGGLVAGEEFGNSVASVGDVDGDGYDDVVVGAYASNLVGAAYWFPGSATGLSATPGATLAGVASGGLFGNDVAAAGDIDGDGFADVLVSAPGLNGGAGMFSLYLGGRSGLDTTAVTTIYGTEANANLGTAVVGVGDVNGDGYGDVLAGAPGANVYTGMIYLYEGAATGLHGDPSLSLSPPSRAFGFGSDIAPAGDVDGDGYDDVVVCAFSTGAYVYQGSADGLPSTPTTTLTLPYTTDMCSAIAGVGDVNGDGYDDVVVGADSTDFYAGAAYLFFGSSGGLSTNPGVTWEGSGTFSQLGVDVAPAGDVNGDGYADVLVGGSGDMSVSGAAWVFLGGATVATTADTSLVGGHAGDYFGWGLAGADVDGDRLSDILVGGFGANRYTGEVSVYGHPVVDLDEDGFASDVDCNDGDATTFPGATELPGDDVDEDCDGQEICYADVDGDGWWSGTVASTDVACDGVGELTASAPGDDCDDADGTIHPGGQEQVGDGVDSDCDGGEVCFVDADGDGFRSDGVVAPSTDLTCTSDGLAPADEDVDCDDENDAVHPGATEITDDGIDQDCNGTDDHQDDADTGLDGGGDSGGVTEDPDAKDPAGCGCAVGGPADPRGAGLLAVGLALVAGRRRYKKS